MRAFVLLYGADKTQEEGTETMIGLGTLLNSAGILVGGLVGLLAGKRFRPEQQEALRGQRPVYRYCRGNGGDADGGADTAA